AAPSAANGTAPIGNKPAARSTRLALPSDIVRLSDRLLYVLQPSLETLLGGSLALPHDPFPYQLDGVAFLYPRVAALLADEMGLGKTMQAIVAMRLLLHAGEIRRALLICPKPLVTNWQREFASWAPEIPLTIVEGDATRREWLWRLPEAVVTIANYELVHRDRELVADPEVGFDLVVLDESQRIKNRSGATSQAVCGIRRRRSWALTGTPVENSAEDLVGIFEFVQPGHLTPGMKPRRLAREARDYVLRRTKDQVLDDLPPKLIRDAELTLTTEQRETYRQAEDEGVVRLSELGQSITVQHVFELVLRLKQICNFDPATGESAKLDRLMADLEEIADSGKKAIIFSQWVETLRWLAAKLNRFKPLQYHGQIPSNRRDSMVQQFRDDPKSHVMLMSYGAGGVGLNLQFAGYVFLFDRWWNPAVEDQAIARAHRIGAAGPVTVTRFLSVGTIEERINQVLEQKREVFDTIFHDGEMVPRSVGLTQSEIFGLFDLHTPKGRLDAAA
ncbi:MAG: DEAD/DEAH box helicase, partial [Planctomycetia bacterium]|nr:DEAD/DEAH box helicase [Planctomycetia bacterium]